MMLSVAEIIVIRTSKFFAALPTCVSAVNHVLYSYVPVCIDQAPFTLYRTIKLEI